MIEDLIDKQDSFEIIRDKVALIIATESASQQALATVAGKDSDDWKLRVFTERNNPWEQFLNSQSDASPLINVWYDNSSFDQSGSNILERQKTEAVINIDCYGFGLSKDDGGAGHIAGDQEAALEVQKALRLARNILMAAEYTYLGLRGLVWQRWSGSITVFQPQIDSQNVQNIVGARIALRVIFNEFSPQVNPEILERVSVDVKRAEDGLIVVEADYSYPL